MKSKNHICLVLVCLLLLGCSSTTHIPEVAEVTLTPLPTETNTPLPSATATRTSTLIPTETLTPLPTLLPKQAQEAFKKLFWDNTSCLAPCFMGIIPDKSSYEDVNAIFTNLGFGFKKTAEQDSVEFYATGYTFDSGIENRVRLYVQSGIVKGLLTLIQPPGNQGTSVRHELSTYSPNTLIDQYGLPSKVEFFADRGPSPLHVMYMYFDTRDLIVEYGYDLRLNLRVCPLTDQLHAIRIWLGQHLINPPSKAVPLEDATQMTMEDFSKLMTGNQNKACFYLKEEKFP
jgi:hypothetical protein